ncbi:serine hydrolase [Actinomadura geliboluensis]|uniref:serine hydrolase n=1 Tax=Actinomadura geliboluensis TaxID=882440 RepID=UPI003724746E
MSRLSAATSAGEFSGAVLVQRHGEIVHSEAYGPRDRETNAPNTTDTCFCVASRGKMFTAVVVMRLVRERVGSSCRHRSAATSPDWRTPASDGRPSTSS